MTPTDLQFILRARLPEIRRWGMVSVYKWNSKWLPWYIYQPTEGMCYIIWTNSKGKNIHEYEYREIPIKDLPEVIQRNKQKLYNKVKTHR